MSISLTPYRFLVPFVLPPSHSSPSHSHYQATTGLFFSVLVFFTFLQCWVGFCHTTMRICHNYPYILSPPSLPPLTHPIPLGHHRVPDCVTWATQQLLTSYPSYTHSVYMLLLPSPFVPLSPSPTVSTNPFPTAVSPFPLSFTINESIFSRLFHKWHQAVRSLFV